MTGRTLLLMTLVASGCVRSATASSARNATELSGWVSDSGCGALHTKPGGEDCIRKCLRGGASVGHPEWLPQKLVLVVDGSHRILAVENPDALMPYAGRRVQVKGFIDAASLRVQNVVEMP